MIPNSYPKVYQLGHRWIDGILEGEYHLEEKIDGSQLSWGIYNGELHIRSKGQQLYIDNPEKMFAEGIKYIASIKGELTPNLTYRGEYLQKPKHNTLAYSRVPRNHIMIFDIEDANGNPLSYNNKALESANVDLECIPVFTHKIAKPDDILEILKTGSCLGGQLIEGVVVKNYNKITPDGKYMVGKFVSEQFKERHGKEWKKSNPNGKDIVQLIIESLKTDARYFKAVQHLRENGQLTEMPADIGNLLKEIHLDIEFEESEYIKDTLYKHFINNIKRGVCGGFAEWYKEQLLKNSFTEVA